MTSPKNYLIALLVLTTLGGAWFAWRQHAELAELRAATLNKDERADLQKRLWDLEKLNRELRDQLATMHGPGSEEGRTAGLANRDFGPRGGRGDPRRDFGPQLTAVRDLMAKPEVQAMLNLQQQSALDGRYAALFKNLNLQPEQVDRLKTLLAERATTVMDVMSAARDQGIDPRENPEAFRKLVTDAQNEINNSIKSLIGESGFAQLTNYEQTLPQRNVVNQLEQRLSYTNTPLTSAQAEQLVQILAKNSPRAATANPAQVFDAPIPGGGHGPAVFIGGPPPGRGPDVGGMVMSVFGPGAAPMMSMVEPGRGGSTAPVTPAAIAESQTILSPPQTQALQQIQQQQQAQQQLKQMVHDTLTTNAPPPPSGAPNAPPPRKPPGGD